MNSQPKKEKMKSIIIFIILAILLLLIIFAEDIIKLQNKNKIGLSENTAQAGYITTIGDKTFDITNAVVENANPPTISAGMIPIKWDGSYWMIASQDNWYEYTTGQPAYIMLNDGTYQSELVRDMTNKKLAKENIGAQIQENELGSIYMWLPRYAYNEQGEIIHIKQGYTVAGSWTMPQIFAYETEKMDFSLAGVWVEYNPLSSTSEVTTKIRNMTGEENQYGFIANTKPIAMNKTDSTAIEKYSVGAGLASALNDTTNLKRTILKITNTSQPEPIKAKAYYDKTEDKIKIEVTYRKNAITKILNSKGDILSESSLVADTGDEVIGNKTYKFVIIDDLGNQKQVLVSVTGLDIYIIENEEDLKLFRDAVNAGKTTSNTKAYQIADVKMNEGKYTIATETGNITFSRDAEQWIPINQYRGKYYGNNYKISGVYINGGSSNQALFAYGTAGTSIQNLNLINSSITGTQNVAGIVAQIDGICTLNNCSFSGNITATSRYTGGIVGYITTAKNVNIINCSVNGIIEGTSYTGGIIGKVYSMDTTGSEINLNIEGCNNNAYVKGDSSTGGIIGEIPAKVWYNYNIINSSNSGYILGSSCVGGIIGNVIGNDDYHVGNLTGLSNIGNVQGTSDYIGRNNWKLF